VKLKTKWRQFPEEVRAHLAHRLLDRSITTDDLSKLKFWIESDPDVPEENWYKDFGTFKLAGRGPLVLTFLTNEQIGYGTELRE
jgi:hypothetical protein